MMFFGMFGIPLGPPKPSQITVIVGKPIEIPKNANPSQDEIEKYHEIFLKATEKLYEDNKVANGSADISLRII
jgi:2-acylglycerol O-acyltransferase 2